jgi:metal-responsive CopG/Arc/MetJ family transcriptional regulator
MTGRTFVILAVMKTAISIPDRIFRQAERAAKKLRMSRSEFFTRAAIQFLKTHPIEDVKASYDLAFAETAGEDDLIELQKRVGRAALRNIEWR